AAVLAAAGSLTAPRAASRSAAAPAAAPAAAARPARRNRKSRPYRKHQQQQHERGEDQAEELSDGQELQMIEPVGSKSDAASNWRVERVPNGIAQFHREPRRPPIAWRRDLDVLAGVKHDKTENPADRLREARRGVLGR